MGVNAAGLGVCVNALPQLPSAPEGVPVAFVVRLLLQCRDLAEASRVVLAIPHATNQHYVIAEAGDARSFEVSAAGVTEYHAPNPTRILHTNHPLGAEKGRAEPEAHRENTVARLSSLEQRLSTGRPALAEVQAALSAVDDPRHPVCRLRSPDSGLIGFTTGSIVSALRPDPAPVESWISAGPPSLGGYSRKQNWRERPFLSYGARQRARRDRGLSGVRCAPPPCGAPHPAHRQSEGGEHRCRDPRAGSTARCPSHRGSGSAWSMIWRSFLRHHGLDHADPDTRLLVAEDIHRLGGLQHHQAHGFDLDAGA